MALNQYEIRQNEEQCDLIDALIQSELQQIYQHQPQKLAEQKRKLATARQCVFDYAVDNDITLLNLTSNEFAGLKTMVDNWVKDEHVIPNQLQTSLPQWKNTLQQAVAGYGNRIYQSRSTGMEEDLRRYGIVPAGKWGTDLDVRHILKKELITFVGDSTIKAAGVYILAPVSLTEAPTALQDRIETAQRAILANHVQGVISLQIPVNCHDSHWRLAQISLFAPLNQAPVRIIEATLWDSMGGSADKNDPAYKNLTTAIEKTQPLSTDHIEIAFEKAGIQTNGYSCMDYVVRQALIAKHIDNPITRARENNPQELRQAIVTTIAENAGLSCAKQLREDPADHSIIDSAKFIAQQKPDTSTKSIDKTNDISKIQDCVHMFLRRKENEEKQIAFDEDLANEIDKTSKNNTTLSENEAFTEGFKKVFDRHASSLGNS